MKADTLSKLQQAARDGACRLIYFDQSGFSASPPVQRGWSPIGEPHRVVAQPHCRRSVLGAFDFGANLLRHEARKATIKRPDIIQFLDQIAQEGKPGLMTVVVLDNASIHHNIDQETIDRWFLEHRMVLCRVAAVHYCAAAPSEPCMHLLMHTAQAFQSPRLGAGFITVKPRLWICRWQSGWTMTRFDHASDPPSTRRTI